MIMKKDRFRIIGVMSGTSLDGIDLALIDFNTKSWDYNIIESTTIPYSEKWIKTLLNIYNLDIENIYKIDKNYTRYLGEIINDFIKKNKITNIDLVSSHGHTAKHVPEDKVTYQLGNLSSINYLFNLKTICDFRTQDVKLNGQGAPLVPIGDKILFSDYDVCLNLGGFANISREFKGKRIAFDVCSVNLVFNYLAQMKFMQYDKNGELARSGVLIKSMYNKLNQIDFYNLSFPKSLGVEWNVKEIYPIIDEELKISSLEDVTHTYLMHVVLKISDCLKFDDKVLVTGGGALNKFLIKTLKSKTKAQIVIPSVDLINYKEALIFGLIGLLRFLKINNCLSSVTGTYRDHCSGKIIEAK